MLEAATCEICRDKFEPSVDTLNCYYLCSDECKEVWMSLPTTISTTCRMFHKWRQERNPEKEIPLVPIRIAKRLKKLIPEYNLFAERMNWIYMTRPEDNMPLMEIVCEDGEVVKKAEGIELDVSIVDYSPVSTGVPSLESRLDYIKKEK